MSGFNEANTIEEAIRDRLSALPGNNWAFIHGADLPREAQDVLIGSWLKDALCRLNSDIDKDPEKADEVIYKLRGVLVEARHSGLVRANELFTEWLRGEKSMPLGKDGEHITINLIDYDDHSKNHYVVSQQVPSMGAKNAFFDLVLYVNGIPLVVGEVKTPVRMAISWQDGASDFMGGDKYYWANQSSFFVPNLLCFATEGKTFAYGAVNAGFKHWMPWHKTTDGDEIPQNMNTVLTSAERLLEPQTLLELLQSFALYSATKLPNSNVIKRIKLLPRYPQYEAAKQIVERVKSGEIRKGLIWHFQGSGKSLLMLYAAKMLKADPDLKNPTVVVVVDRVDLDSQINTTFDNADVKNVTPVKSCKQLSKQLKHDSRNVLVTTIFKFDDVEIDENNKDGLNPRENIIVLVDEAHRTQEGMLGEKMRWALPNAYFFGLTGTPISGLERNTFRLFGADQDQGRYMNRYSYKQSIRDEATLPVKFEPRLAELRVDQEAIDKEFDALAEANNLTEEEKTQLSQKAGKLAHLLKAPKRMEAIADDIQEHFTSHVEPKGLKAMVVVYDREACVLMYDLLTKRFGEGTCEVVMNLSQGGIDDETDENGHPKKKASDWVKWDALGLPLDKLAFKRWQAIDASSTHQEKVLDQYRDSSDPLKVLIVTAKLLTGFDAPICYCMYLDKPLRDHTLLQAMCRTNRLYDDSKRHGLIIDYLGVFENLAKALAYDPKEIEGVVDQLGKYKDEVPVALEKCLALFEGVDRTVGGYEGLIAAQERLASNEVRDLFAAQFNVLKKLWEALTPDPFLAPYQRDYRWLAQVYDSVRPVGGLGSLIWQALGPETIRLIHQYTDIDQIRDDLDELVMDADSLFTLSEAEQKRRGKRLEISLIAKVRHKSGDPRYVELGKRLERLREQYEAGVISSINWLKELLEAARETVQLDNGANDDDKIVEDNKLALSELFKEVRNDQTPQIISRIVDDIDKIVKATRFPGWQNTTAGDREMKQVLRKTLLKYQLHRDAELFDKAYAYISEHY
ncbi:type I restriction endonuclease subunit R [Thalassospira mesophila]|uniref:Type I restriction enzyme endonuclease subunit n=1 Tax=Thalassospira mesophila TaxID=1293891 RepID=A0A1Y2KVN1_9PROT|nr:HsdR family type I site-specific deoxyribonuclease [Thalassospira mesophila]OSQ35489.1 DEAD/DEAH box helicase [Thalassospira mesophila]